MKPTPRTTKRHRIQPLVEELEWRWVPTGGTWTALASSGGGGTMMLLSDGTAMVQGLGITNAWSRLTPDSTGSYVNGTFSNLASMNTSRLYFASNVLTDGRVFVYGGEYSNGSQNWVNSGEIYNPLNNTWTTTATNSLIGNFGDDPSEVLADGTVLCGYLSGPQTYIYHPTTSTWSQGPTKLDSDRSDEEGWVKLADGSILSYDVWDSQHAQRYVPSLNQWVETGAVPVALENSADELGPGILLPDGRALYIGANGNTALYTPGVNPTDPGTWANGPVVPNGLGANDAAGAVLPNGDVIFTAGTTPSYSAPTELFEFNPTTNSISTLSTPSALTSQLNGDPSFVTRMLVLPTGQVLLSAGTGQLWAFTPNGSAQAAWAPSISNITNNGDGTYTLTGTQLTGMSEGAAYGDDAEMSSNYPIVQLTSGSGQVYYARTYNWSSTGVQTGSTVETTLFTLPSGLPNGSYSLTAIANGIASTPVSFQTGSQTLTVVTPATANPNPVTGTTTSLSVLGGDPAGESSLTYTWTVTNQPAGSTTPVFTFSTGISNGTNGAKNAIATFFQAGAYTFTATLADPSNQTVSSSVNVTVNPALASISVSPGNVSLGDKGQQQFQAVGLDQFGVTLASQPKFTWSIATGGIGSINSTSGLYTAPNSGTGSATVKATSGTTTGTATVTITPQPPVITQAASANPDPATGTTTQLKVQATDPQGSTLTYSWAVTGQPTGATTPTFNNAHSNQTNATFYQAGSYTFTVTVQDALGLSMTSSVTEIVAQTLTSLSITPGNLTVAKGATQQFTAVALDQFGTALATQPTFTWQVNSNGGTLSNSGLYTAPNTTGTFQVKASAGGKSAQANVTVATAPAAPTSLTATASVKSGNVQVQLQWKNASNNQTGFVIQRSSDNGVTWTTVAQPAGNLTTYTDTTASGTTTYLYRIYAYNAIGTSGYSNVATVTTPA
jgi:hypothetical protein